MSKLGIHTRANGVVLFAKLCFLKSCTRDNPGRRFEDCKYYDPITKSRGCKYFKWCDRIQTDWQKDLINELLMEKKELENKLGKYGRDLEYLVENMGELLAEIEYLKASDCVKCKNNVDVWKCSSMTYWIIIVLIIFVIFKLGA
ncbi:hypothetical protein RND81_04G098400 [Saponaria officinalis]|uniref:Zinc finger GRF-type domain-containing protein n=1 Tax=Saponaria officinalis TaxID=3572 RepID=A0AAW1LJQ9_SAPOF